MKTIKQIGHDALQRLLNSARFRDVSKDGSHRVVFYDGEQVLDKPQKDNYRRNHDEGDYKAGDYVMVWGIELGLRRLELEVGVTLFDSIVKQVIVNTSNPLPSHIIVCAWSYSDHHEDEVYHVFRFSQEQEQRFQKAQQALTATSSGVQPVLA